MGNIPQRRVSCLDQLKDKGISEIQKGKIKRKKCERTRDLIDEGKYSLILEGGILHLQKAILELKWT